MSISVRVSGNEFSRYYPSQKVIGARVTTSAVNGTVVTFTLVREDGYGVVATKTGTVTSGSASASFNLDTDCIIDGVYRAKQGEYHVAVSIPGPQTAVSDTFYVMVVSVRELKDKYLRGVDLLATNILEPQNQPFTTLTGVDITNTAPTQFKGIYTLAWGGTGTPTLSWDGGATVTIDLTDGFSHAVLVNSKRNAYIEVDVTTDLLPSAAVQQSVILDRAEIEDSTLRTFLIDAYDDIQGRIFVAVEPTTYDSDRVGDPAYTGEFADEYVDPLSYYRDDQFPAGKFLSIRFPHPWIGHRAIERLDFYFNETKSATINIAEWIVNLTKANSGLVEFVPNMSAVLIFSWFSTAGFAFLTRWATVPSAWHYRLTAGLPDLHKDGRTRVRRAIALKATIDALLLAGLASAPGLSGESISKDGVSQSKSYANAEGGRYGLTIAAHKNFLFGPNGNGGEIIRLRQKLLGLFGISF